MWEVFPDLHEVVSPKGRVRLSLMEWKLFQYFLSNEGRLLSRQRLLADVWGYHFNSESRTANIFIGRLRRLMELNPEKPRHFISLRGAGYVFVRNGYVERTTTFRAVQE